ncbi:MULTISPECIES: minor capsid protein [unclassified Halomonas]|uniref:phage head morphogenesis protein n=1 Tax=unclassified Halomonas TaxID=2609666 RepID=UPI0020768043|nr:MULTISPECIES: minor capsid protein [unclassified Halomonas]
MAKPKWAHPQAIESEYVTTLRHYARRCQRATNELLMPEIDALVVQAGLRGDALGDQPTNESSWADRLADMLKRILAALTGIGQLGIFANMRGPGTADDVGVRDYGARVEAFNKRQLQRQVERVYGERYSRREPWLDGLMRAWELENLKLIRSIPEQYVERLQGVVTRAISQGLPTSAVKDEIRAQYKHPMNRADLIAEDQIGKLNAQITEYRQKAVGIKEYIWRGIDDGRERPEHRARNGKVFRWSHPPPDGHPGMPIHCRCRAEGVWPTREEARLNDNSQPP